MIILGLVDFMQKNYSKNDTMNENKLQKVYKYSRYPRDAKIYSDKGFISTDSGAQGGTHWTGFYIKNNKPFHFDSFGGAPDKFPLNQLPKPITYHNNEIQDENSRLCGIYCLCFFNNSRLCGIYCLCFFYLIEVMDYYDGFEKVFCINICQ